MEVLTDTNPNHFQIIHFKPSPQSGELQPLMSGDRAGWTGFAQIRFTGFDTERNKVSAVITARGRAWKSLALSGEIVGKEIRLHSDNSETTLSFRPTDSSPIRQEGEYRSGQETGAIDMKWTPRK